MKRKTVFILTVIFVVLLSSCVEISLAQVENIHVDWQPKDVYLVGEEVVLEEINMTAHFDDGTSEVFSLANTNVFLRNGYYEDEDDEDKLKLDTRTHGDYDIRVSYQGVSVKLNFSVYDAIVDEELDNGTHSKIDDAIDDEDISVDTRWIYVREGTYTGRLEIDKSLKLKTSEQAVINADGDDHAITIRNTIQVDDLTFVSIEGFVITGNWTGLGIVQVDGTNDNDVVSDNAEVHIIDNWIHAPSDLEAKYYDGQGSSVQITGDNSQIIGNTIYIPKAVQLSAYFNQSGILLVDGSNIAVKNNTIIGNEETIAADDWYWDGIYGIRYIEKDKVLNGLLIEENTISGAYSGIHVVNDFNSDQMSSNVDIINNFFINNLMDIVFHRHEDGGGFENLTIDGNEFLTTHSGLNSVWIHRLYMMTTHGAYDYDLSQFAIDNELNGEELFYHNWLDNDGSEAISRIPNQ